jgi:hypothetical protein
MQTPFLKVFWTALFLSFSFLIIAQPSGRVVWWGRDDFWKQGYSDHTNGVIESDCEIVSNVVAVAGRLWLGLLQKSDGTVIGVGNHIYGGNEVPAGLSNVISISAEGNSCWAVRRDGTVARWGGDSDEANLVGSLSNVVSITWAGYRSYLALKSDGTVLGFRLNEERAQVRQVKAGGRVLSNVVSIASQGYTPVILKDDGTVFCLGYQTPGKPVVEPRYEAHDNVLYEYLGAESARLPYEYTTADPVEVGGQVLSNVVLLAGGGGPVLALKKDGHVVAWGSNAYDAATVPGGLENVAAIATAQNQSLALKRDGTVVAWGADYSHQTSVPAGLSNVVAIASAGDFNLAVTTGAIPSSVFITPHGRIEMTEREADLVFKGQVISSMVITNTAFPEWAEPHATKFKAISVFKGECPSNIVTFLHITGHPMAWSGSRPPPSLHFNAGESYLIFAAKADKPEWLYSPSKNFVASPGQFHQLMKADAPIRTLDNRQLATPSVKEAHWRELNLLLQDTNPTNQIYAVDQLDGLSLANRRDDRWNRSEDFKRRRVLDALLPLVTNANERVAARAIGCFATETNMALVEPFSETLVNIANSGPTNRLRLDAIAALSGTHFGAVSNSFAQLLQSPVAGERARAVALLSFYPGEFTETSLQKCAEDVSPKVRASVATVIGDRKWERLLPTLVKLFGDPVGRSQPVAPLTLEELEAGGQIVGVEGGTTIADDPAYPGANVGDVHTSTGYALLKFDESQVGETLKTNLNDRGFRLQFLLKLAETDPQPWISDLLDIVEARRARILKQAVTDGIPAQSAMYLSGAYFRCWRFVCSYLENLPASEFAEGKNDRALKVLEQAGNTGSQEPVSLYRLYRMKGLNGRAVKFRAENGKNSGYDLGEFFNRVDAEFPTNTIVPSK